MNIVSVFGSSRVQPDDADYELAVTVGRVLAEAGYAVMTGGYGGVMAAASKGANEAGGHVIGVTTKQIEEITQVDANQWVKEEIMYDALRDRLLHLVKEANAGYVALPGGVGTLHEIAETWELMRFDGIEQKPFICYGDYWEGIITQVKMSPYVGDFYRQLMKFAHTPEEIIQILHNWKSEHNA